LVSDDEIISAIQHYDDEHPEIHGWNTLTTVGFSSLQILNVADAVLGQVSNPDMDDLAGTIKIPTPNLMIDYNAKDE